MWRKERKWKKMQKGTSIRKKQRNWLKKCTEFIISFDMMQVKKGRKEKESKRIERCSKRRETLGKFLEVILSLLDDGTDFAERQCQSRRSTTQAKAVRAGFRSDIVPGTRDEHLNFTRAILLRSLVRHPLVDRAIYLFLCWKMYMRRCRGRRHLLWHRAQIERGGDGRAVQLRSHTRL